MKKSSLAAGLEAASSRKLSPASKAAAGKSPGTVLVGAHFKPEVRHALLLVRSEKQNMGKNLKQLLGEAINDLCAKYGKPEPYTPDDI